MYVADHTCSMMTNSQLWETHRDCFWTEYIIIYIAHDPEGWSLSYWWRGGGGGGGGVGKFWLMFLNSPYSQLHGISVGQYTGTSTVPNTVSQNTGEYSFQYLTVCLSVFCKTQTHVKHSMLRNNSVKSYTYGCRTCKLGRYDIAAIVSSQLPLVNLWFFLLPRSGAADIQRHYAVAIRITSSLMVAAMEL